VLVSELSGKGAVLRKAQDMGLKLEGDDERVAGVLKRLKEREHRGYHYEAADASLELLLRNEIKPYEPLFRLESFRVLVEKREDGKAVCEATIKIHVGGERIISTAEGNGPVNALDTALRQAIAKTHPHLSEIELVNYKVRILDENKGTGAVTRVLLDASDGEESWGSIGVSENIIEASWDALVDSIEFGMLRGREE
ncbi:MAG TPA: alpha-isopropylmalate synthase regulatory domain-containing protein, partial [Gaiellaceae bacterium]